MKPRLLQVYLIMYILVIGLVKRTAAVCGHPTFSQRVVGGKNSLLGKWPWQISVMYGNIHICGGSLISRRWVVTAAHCITPEILPTSTERKRRMSSNNYQGFTDRRRHQKRQANGDFYVMMGMLSLSSTSIVVPVNNMIINPIYNGDGTSGDLVLLELARPVTFNNYIQPICLPSLNQVFPDGMMCWLTGWGDTAEGVHLDSPYTLQEVELPLINSTTCNSMLIAANNITSTVTIVQDDMICAGYNEGKKDGCQGDSGGPLACQLGNSWFLVGIMSWGVGCGRPREPGVYTKVSNFSTWIQQNSVFSATTTNTLIKKPTPASKSFSLAIDIRINNQAGQRLHMAATHLLFLVPLLRALDIM